MKAVLVNSSILPILLQAMVLQLPLAMQAAVQVRSGGGWRPLAALCGWALLRQPWTPCL